MRGREAPFSCLSVFYGPKDRKNCPYDRNFCDTERRSQVAGRYVFGLFWLFVNGGGTLASLFHAFFVTDARAF